MFQPNNTKTVPSIMQVPPETPVRRRTRGIVPFVAAMSPNAVVFALTLQFYSVPRGAVIRPDFQLAVRCLISSSREKVCRISWALST